MKALKAVLKAGDKVKFDRDFDYCKAGVVYTVESVNRASARLRSDTGATTIDTTVMAGLNRLNRLHWEVLMRFYSEEK